MEILALLFALSPIIATLIYWVYKTNVRTSEKNVETASPVFDETPVVAVASVAVAAASVSSADEIAVVLAAAAAIYVKSTN